MVNTKHMRAYLLSGGRVRLAEVPVPVVGPYDALVRITQTSVCGTDLQIIQQDDWAKANVPEGTVIGHEAAGEIIALGSKVGSTFVVGDFVALESHYACPECLAMGNSPDACAHQGILGVYGSMRSDGTRELPRSGAFAEYVAMPVSSLHHVPKELMANFQASLLEPAGNSWKIAQHFLQHGVPKLVAVFGCGPHGIFAQILLRHIGVEMIIAVDPNASRKTAAIEYAADFAAAPEALTAEFLFAQSLPTQLDAALDCAGAPGIVDQGIALLRPGGTMVMFGLPKFSEQNVDGIPYDQIIFGSRQFDLTRDGKTVHVVGFNGRSVEGWKTLIAELTASAALRAKLMLPLENIGALEQLQEIIAEVEEGKFTRDHKIGMIGFKN